MRSIVLIGMKGCGKTTVGRTLAERLAVSFLDSDTGVERLHAEQSGESLTFRQIFERYGRSYFHSLETAVLQALAQHPQPFVLATGGGLPLHLTSQAILPQLGTIVFLDASPETLLPRILANGVPSFFQHPENPARSLAELLAHRRPIYHQLADLVIEVNGHTPEELAQKIVVSIQYPVPSKNKLSTDY